MKKRIIIIGKKSFIGSNIFLFLKKKKIDVKILDFEKFIKLDLRLIKNIDYIINCAINKNYLNKKYNHKKDLDLLVAKKIYNLKCKQIFFSTRKVYKNLNNISENSTLFPKCQYSKNKILTEKNLKKIMKDRLTILRVTNIIGMNFISNNSRKVHEIFINIFFENIRKGIIYENKKIYKDFLSIEKFLQIIYLILKKDIHGTYNVSMGQKVYLNQLIKWLNFYNKKKFIIKKLPNKFNKDSFFLNNSKLKKKIGVKIELIELEKYCKRLSKHIFKII